MRIDWKIWNYSGRKAAQARFVLFCLAVLFYGIILFIWPEKPSLSSSFWIPVLLVIVCGLLACFFGYRGFCFSEDWFRAKETQRADWWDKHPRLRTANNILGWIFYSLVFAYLIWNAHRK
jgi:hypothetical protein